MAKIVYFALLLWLIPAICCAQHNWQKPKPLVPKAAIEKIIGPLSTVKPSRKLHLLWVWGYDKHHKPGAHDYVRVRDLFVELLEKVEDVTIETVYGFPTDKQFRNADLAVFYLHLPDLSNNQFESFRAYIERGGGVVALHETAIMRPSSKGRKLAKCLGMAWDEGRSKWGAVFEDITIMQSHEIFKGFPEKLKIVDEFYWDLHKLDSAVVLGSVRSGPPRQSRGPVRETSLSKTESPVFWTLESGKGRVFGTTLGHNTFSYYDPELRIVLFRAMAWAVKAKPDPFMPLVFDGITRDGMVGTTNDMRAWRGKLREPPNEELETTSRLPNIVFILADDLGYGDIKSFGGNRCRINTPHFDRLAREGMRFTHAYATASVCVPSRMSIMSGRYAFRSDQTTKGGPWGFIGTQFKTDQFTIADMLRTHGYRTGYVGKWHLGTLMTTTDGKVQGINNVDYDKPLKIGPPEYGFDESFILPGSLDMYPYAFVRNNRWVGKVTATKGWSAFGRMGPAAEDFEDVKVLSTFADEAERFINANKRKPFFLYMGLTAPHTPTSPTKRFEGKSEIGLYGDFVMNTDHTVGQVLSSLDKAGVAQNTIVIASSDHGPASYAGAEPKATYLQMKNMEKQGHFAAGPFRGYKFSIYEGAFRVPFVARWPGVVKPGETSDELIGLIDLMATLGEVIGAKLKAEQAPDSISFLPLLKNSHAKGDRNSVFLQGTHGHAFRAGDWKLAFCPGSGATGKWGNLPIPNDAWASAIAAYGKLPKSHDDLYQAPFVQLFNLSEDPGESVNLAAKHPQRVEMMRNEAQDLLDQGRTTNGPKLKNDRQTKLFRFVPKSVWKK